MIDILQPTRSDVTNFTIQPLVSQKSYLIKVSAITNRGEGIQVTTTGTTSNANSMFGKRLKVSTLPSLPYTNLKKSRTEKNNWLLSMHSRDSLQGK